MATKTKSKTATKKPAAHKPAKAAVAHKSTAKAKVEKKAKLETHALRLKNRLEWARIEFEKEMEKMDQMLDRAKKMLREESLVRPL